MASIAFLIHNSVEYQRTSPLSTDVKHPSLDPGNPHSNSAAKQNGHHCSHPDCNKVRDRRTSGSLDSCGALYSTTLNSFPRVRCSPIKVLWLNTNSLTVKIESTNVPNARKVSNGSIICKYRPGVTLLAVDNRRCSVSQAWPYVNARGGQASQMSHSELQTHLLRCAFVEATHRKCPSEHSRGHPRRWQRELPRLPARNCLRQTERCNDEQ